MALWQIAALIVSSLQVIAKHLIGTYEPNSLQQCRLSINIALRAAHGFQDWLGF